MTPLAPSLTGPPSPPDPSLHHTSAAARGHPGAHLPPALRQNWFLQTPLHKAAAARGAAVAVLTHLLAGGADPNIQDSMGCTAVHMVIASSEWALKPYERTLP